MPPFGVAEALAPIDLVGSADLFQFWLQTHAELLGAKFWRTAVMRECLPDPDGELLFVSLSPLVQIAPRTALVRVALGGVQ